VIIGLALACLCAIVTNVGFLLKHRGAVAAPPVDARHPLRSAADLFRSRWWTIGWSVAFVAFAIHAAALALAPLSVVQAVVAGGLVFLAVLAERSFGFKLGRREWAGVAVAAAGLAFLGLTQRRGVADPHTYSLAGLIAFESAVLAIGGLFIAASIRSDSLRSWEGELLGLAAGALFGVSDVAVKYLAHPVLHGLLGIVSPWTLAALVASAIAFYSSARSLQIGPAIEVITMTSVAANIAAIMGGVIVFHDSLGSGGLGIVERVAAFALVVGGAALMPAPVKSAAATDATCDPSAGAPGAAPQARA
jgi:drug/metabolite transporter (DMT)-like permease